VGISYRFLTQVPTHLVQRGVATSFYERVKIRINVWQRSNTKLRVGLRSIKYLVPPHLTNLTMIATGENVAHREPFIQLQHD
jgi:hypothetical protein